MATREEMLSCVEREIRMRERVYPEWIKLGRMTEKKAGHELATMRAVLAVVAALPVVPPPQAELFTGRGSGGGGPAMPPSSNSK